MIHRITTIALLLVSAGFSLTTAAQDFRSQFETQTALSLAMLARSGVCAEMGRLASMLDAKRSEGMSLVEARSRIDKLPDDLMPVLTRQLATSLVQGVFSRTQVAGVAIDEEVTNVCAAQLSEQLTIKSAASMPDSERNALEFVMSDKYIPLGRTEPSSK